MSNILLEPVIQTNEELTEQRIWVPRQEGLSQSVKSAAKFAAFCNSLKIGKGRPKEPGVLKRLLITLAATFATLCESLKAGKISFEGSGWLNRLLTAVGGSRKPPAPPPRQVQVDGDGDEPFDLDAPLLYLSQLDAFSGRHAVESMGIWGAVGSGKTSGSGATFAKAYLRAGWGGLVNCVKADERALWERYARETGRSNSLIIVSPSQPWRCNLLNYMLKRPGVIGSRTETLTNLLMTMNEISQRGDKSGGGKGEKFFEHALRQLTRNAIEICVLARGTLSVPMLHKLIMSAPRSHDEVHDPAWQEGSFCYQLIVEADGKEKNAHQQNDFDLAASYFLKEFVDFPPETRGSVLATWGVVADAFLRGQMAELFGGETNFVPELSHNGAVIILDLPVRIYGQAGVFVQAAFTYLWQLAAEQRDIGSNPRPAFWFCDEAAEIIPEYSTQFLATARSSRIASVLLGQHISGYYAAFGGESGKHRVQALLGCMSCHIFHANGDAEHNRWASSLFAKGWQTRTNFSTSRGGTQDSSSGGGSDSLESKVLEAEFTTLRKGGPENGSCTEAIVFQGGRVFRATGDTYLKTIFRQSAQ